MNNLNILIAWGLVLAVAGSIFLGAGAYTHQLPGEAATSATLSLDGCTVNLVNPVPCYENNTESNAGSAVNPSSMYSLEFGVAIGGAEPGTGGGSPIITSFTGTSSSTSVGFGFVVNQDCAAMGGPGNPCQSPAAYGTQFCPDGNPTWTGGAYGDPMWYSLAYYPAGSSSPSPADFVLDGAQYQTTASIPALTPAIAPLSGNGTEANTQSSAMLYACRGAVDNYGGLSGVRQWVSTQSFGTELSGLSTFPDVSLMGVGEGFLAITFHAGGYFCQGYNGYTGAYNTGTDCDAVLADLNLYGEADTGLPDGQWSVAVTALVPIVSGGGSVALSNPSGDYYNGGTVSVVVTTGYAGAAGWTLETTLPSARVAECPSPTSGTGSGQITSACNADWTTTSGLTSPVTIGSDQLSPETLTFKIPAGASQYVSTTGWNTYSVVLYSAFWSQWAAIPVAISAAYIPGVTNVTVTDLTTGGTLGGGAQFRAGDDLEVTLVAYSPVNPVADWVVSVFWVDSALGQSANNAPVCSAGTWITGCGGATVIALAEPGHTGSYTSTYPLGGTFPPSYATGIGIIAYAEAGGAQPGSESYANVALAPIQGPGGPANLSADWFAEIAPYLLATMMLATVGMVMAVAPIDPRFGFAIDTAVGIAAYSLAAFGVLGALV